MTEELHDDVNGARKRAIVVWSAMALGPVAFFVSLLSIGLELLAVSYGVGPKWFSDSSEPPSDLAIFGPIVAVVLAEIIGVVVACFERGRLAGTQFESHATSAIRTFWIMVASFAVANGVLFSLLLIPNMNAVGFGVSGYFIMLAALPLIFIWKTARVVRGLRRAMSEKPAADLATRQI